MFKWILSLFWRKSPTTEDVFQSPYRAPGEQSPGGFLDRIKIETPKGPSVYSKVKKFIMQYFWEFFWSTFLLIVLGFGIFRIQACTNASNAIQHCYIHYQYDDINGKHYNLYGSMELVDDRKIGAFESLPLAVDAAERIKCPLK